MPYLAGHAFEELVLPVLRRIGYVYGVQTFSQPDHRLRGADHHVAPAFFAEVSSPAIDADGHRLYKVSNSGVA
ncbi:MAG: hypothetical protein R3F19_33435 [Verrucomicrobiales bacterium]